MRRGRHVLLWAAAAAALWPGAARADILAAVDVAAPAGRADADVAVLNASTGARLTLPAGTNTTADELHPSISPDGKRLAFLRRDSAAGTSRTVVVDLTTSQSADLFNGFEAAQRPPGDPAMAPSGATVYTGGAFDQPRPGDFSSPVIATGLAPFPAGPFTHTAIRPQYGFLANGRIDDLAAGGSFVAFQESRQGFPGELILLEPGNRASFPLARSTARYANPGLAASNPQVVVLDQRPVSADGTVGRGDIAFVPASLTGFVTTPTALPAIVNSLQDESQPALTADGRYLAFVRHGADGHDRLLLWDSQTQTLLNPAGVDLGVLSSRDSGAVSLFTRPVFLASAISFHGVITIDLLQASGIGIIVQRIRGRHRVLGHRGYTLGRARRVPLGRFRPGHSRIRWNRKVAGHRLRPGRYLVTPRAVTPRAVVRELGRPRVIRIRPRAVTPPFPQPVIGPGEP